MIRKDDAKHAQANADVQKVFQTKDPYAIGELLAGVIDDPQEMIDVWDAVLGEQDFTAETRYEFLTPEHVIGGRALKWENGATVPVAKVTRGKIPVSPEYIFTPAYEFDINDLSSGDLGTVEDIRERATRALLREKNVRGLKLFTAGVTNQAGGLRTVIKGEDPASDLIAAGDKWKWQVDLRTKLERAVKEIQDTTEGGPVSMVLRTVTLGDVESTGFNLSTVRVLPLNAAVDPETDQVLFDEGDILLFGRGVGQLGRALDTQPAVKNDYWTVYYTFRQGHLWVRWQDQGYHENRIRRIQLVPKATGATYVTNPTRGHIIGARLTKTGCVVYFDRSVDASTLNATNVVFSTTQGGAQAASAVSAEVDGTMRTAVISASGLSAGDLWVKFAAPGVQDVAGQDFNGFETHTTVS